VNVFKKQYIKKQYIKKTNINLYLIQQKMFLIEKSFFRLLKDSIQLIFIIRLKA